MTENKRYKSIGTNLECPNGMEYMLIKRNDGVNVCQVCSKYTAKEIVDELNSLAEENEELKQRNNRQAKQLDRIYQLIEEKDWRTLNDILDDFKQCEEQLQREWKCYE